MFGPCFIVCFKNNHLTTSQGLLSKMLLFTPMYLAQEPDSNSMLHRGIMCPKGCDVNMLLDIH